MQHVMGVSWPRSGHHMLVRLLELYFGDRFSYCEFHAGHPTHPDIDTCCRHVPCRHRDRVTLTKNHDFDLSMPQIAGQPYVIQYRAFAPSVVSSFELFVWNGGEDSEAAFREFASRQFGKYLEFKAKWVDSAFAKDQIVLRYDKFLSAPADALERVVRLIDPDRDPDAAQIDRAIQSVDGERIERRKVHPLAKSGVHADRDLRSFRYYSPELFDRIARLRLTAQQVHRIYKADRGHLPSEAEMLELQCHESTGHLARHLARERRLPRRILKKLLNRIGKDRRP